MLIKNTLRIIRLLLCYQKEMNYYVKMIKGTVRE